MTSRIRGALPSRALGAFLTLAGCSSGTDVDSTRSAAVSVDDGYGEGMGRTVESGVVSHLPPLTRQVPAASEIVKISESRPAAPAAPPPSLSPTERVRADARVRGPADEIRIVVQLPERSFGWSRLRQASGLEREAAINDRRAQLKPTQDDVANQITALGATVVRRYWLANALVVDTPATRVDRILDLPLVQGASPGEIASGPGGDYEGDDVRNGTLAASLLSSGHDGENNGRDSTVSNNVKIGIVEGGEINALHVGWADWSGGSSRIERAYVCDSNSCSGGDPYASQAVTPSSSDTHATRVTWAAAGSIEQGQDSNFPGSRTSSQVRRSGAAREAEIYFYRGSTGFRLDYAIEQAVTDGVDILNFSGWMSCSGCGLRSCNSGCNCGGLNQLMRNALDAGVLINACGGNSCDTSSSTCDIWYPGQRPENVAVNQLDSSDDTVDYDDLQVVSNACSGPLPVTTISGVNTTTAGLDLTAPGRIEWSFGMGFNNYNSFNVGGCSFATPVVSGTAALLRDAFNEVGWSGNDARALMVNLMVMGDASDGSTDGRSENSVHAQTGYGRLRAHWPHDDDLTSPWGWGWRNFVIEEGEEVRWPVWDSGPESASVTMWKWAFLWFEDDLTSTSDIIIQVLDTCPAGGGEDVVASDLSFGLRKRVRLDQTEIGGRCLVMRAFAYDTPPGGTRVWSADYFHGGSVTTH